MTPAEQLRSHHCADRRNERVRVIDRYVEFIIAETRKPVAPAARQISTRHEGICREVVVERVNEKERGLHPSHRLGAYRVDMWSDQARRLLEGPNYAALATVHAGQPSCHMMWFSADDEFLYLNTEVHRHKFRRLDIGAKAALMVFENSRSWVEVRATVLAHITGERARHHLDELSQKYNGHPYAKVIESERVVVQLRPDHEFLYRPSTVRAEPRPLWR